MHAWFAPSSCLGMPLKRRTLAAAPRSAVTRTSFAGVCLLAPRRWRLLLRHLFLAYRVSNNPQNGCIRIGGKRWRWFHSPPQRGSAGFFIAGSCTSGAAYHPPISSLPHSYHSRHSVMPVKRTNCISKAEPRAWTTYIPRDGDLRSGRTCGRDAALLQLALAWRLLLLPAAFGLRVAAGLARSALSNITAGMQTPTWRTYLCRVFFSRCCLLDGFRADVSGDGTWNILLSITAAVFTAQRTV